MRQLIIIYFILFSAPATWGQAQYFGQNKPRYKKINFSVIESPHFELFHYFDQKPKAKGILLDSEHWYKLHQEVFKLAFIKPNPLIIYKTHPDFQETTAISGRIGQGTGGVTEGLRNRVVMPMMYSKRQTDHVLGHELVHAFQYKTMIHGSDSTSLANIQNLPLFMVEGLAEYMSLGRENSHTAMWMRDAVLNKDLPSISDLVNKQNKYFPYRWGQAFWAYVTGTYGDDIIRPLFKQTAINGIEIAFQKVLNMDTERFSAKFQASLINSFGPLIAEKEIDPFGTLLASKETGGEMNISPAISPNGELVAYISSKNVLSLDIYIANATNGEILRRIPSTSFGGHVDSYNFIETAGAWSPDSKTLAIVVESKGKNKLVLIDARNGNKKTYTVPTVESFTNPTWSPDGNSLVLTGLVDGDSDLYQFFIKSSKIINLTRDAYSDIQPSFSPDGRFIYFVSDRDPMTARLEKAKFGIARYSFESNKVEVLNIFPEADNFNPQVVPSGNKIIFLSDRDGYRNMYQYDLTKGTVSQLSNYYTGISGITMFSPAISIAAKTGDIVYTYFINGEYNIFKANIANFQQQEVSHTKNKRSGVLPPTTFQNGRNLVEENLKHKTHEHGLSAKSFRFKKYEPRFKLDYLANSGLGVAASQFGTGLGGGITGLFSDMLNNNQLSGTVALNGEIQDIGGQLLYLNQKNPLQFGASISHIPFRFFTPTPQDELLEVIDTTFAGNGFNKLDAIVNQRIARLFVDRASFFAFKPISTTKRFEVGANFTFYSFNVREYPERALLSIADNGDIFQYRTLQNLQPNRIPNDELGLASFNINSVYAAYVGDATTFGTVAPLNGYRYRLQLGQTFGSANFTEIILDARKYFYLKPFTLAGRFKYEGRLNAANTEQIGLLNPLSLAFPWNMHGLNGGGFQFQQLFNNPQTQSFSGNQMAFANLEMRYPFTGPEKLALIPFKYVPSDLNFFLDGGVVWSPQSSVSNGEAPRILENTIIKKPVFTTGLSLRMNILGYVILEPYFAVPIINGARQNTVTGINFMVAGW